MTFLSLEPDFKMWQKERKKKSSVQICYKEYVRYGKCNTFLMTSPHSSVNQCSEMLAEMHYSYK